MEPLIHPPYTIDYANLMDLRVDFAFKLLFTKGDPRMLISLLNAIFANKKIPRVVKSVAIKNPNLEKSSSSDKLSILDIRAQLDDGTAILIEMHMYTLGELKSKTIRSWARAYSEELEIGETYTDQPPTVAITFTNGNIDTNTDTPKIHKLCMIMDREDNTLFSNAMELHYIDMKAFAKAVNKIGSINITDTEEGKFSKWLSVITQKEITNKSILENICEDEEEIHMAVATLARQSEDKYARQAYQRRQDEIYFYNMKMQRAAEAEQRITEAEQRITEAEQLKAEAEQKLKIAVSLLLDKGTTTADIAAILNMSEQEVIDQK